MGTELDRPRLRPVPKIKPWPAALAGLAAMIVVAVPIILVLTKGENRHPVQVPKTTVAEPVVDGRGGLLPNRCFAGDRDLAAGVCRADYVRAEWRNLHDAADPAWNFIYYHRDLANRSSGRPAAVDLQLREQDGKPALFLLLVMERKSEIRGGAVQAECLDGGSYIKSCDILKELQFRRKAGGGLHDRHYVYETAFRPAHRRMLADIVAAAAPTIVFNYDGIRGSQRQDLTKFQAALREMLAFADSRLPAES